MIKWLRRNIHNIFFLIHTLNCSIRITTTRIITIIGEVNVGKSSLLNILVKKNISILSKENNEIIGYGSPAKATTALNFFGISKEIKYIVEDNKLKQGKLLPGMKIPIVSKDSIKSKPNCVLVLAWNFFDEIKEKNKEIANKFINIKDLEG